MTPEMAFECVLVSDDPTVLSTIEPVLHDFSICSRICPQSRRTGDWLENGGTDLIVVDLEAANSFDVLKQVQESEMRQKPTILALSVTDGALPGVHIILRKPLTHDSGMTSLKVAYSRMLRDFRKHTRFALMQSVIATDENNRTFSLTVTNIGSGGVGLKVNETIAIGSLLAFRVKLQGLAREISIRARVLWARPYGVAGCEFVHMPSHDVQLLHAWLESRYRIKKPLIAVE
jgi:glutaredoxin